MRITGALVSAAALLVLSSLPLSAKAQCGVAYGDYAVNEEEGTIDAWTYVAEYVVPECPWYNAYQYGYYDHHYSVSAAITSPTQNSAYDDDYQIAPYGGGYAVAFTSILYAGDPGEYDVEWFISVICTIGGTLGYWLDDEPFTPEDPETPCEGPETYVSMDLRTIHEMRPWPKEPFERNFKLVCFEDYVTAIEFEDSFGLYYDAGNGDPCVSSGLEDMSGPPAYLAAAHSHPWFATTDEYHNPNGWGCTESMIEWEPPQNTYLPNATFQEVQSLNNDNRGYSTNDNAWIAEADVPLYLYRADREKIYRKLTPSGSSITIWED